MKIHHLNLGAMGALPNDPNPKTICHCLLLEGHDGLILIDTGLGLAEMQYPHELLGQELMNVWNFEIDPNLSALRQLETKGIKTQDVRHIVMTHLDVDHAGGLVDFPHATVHLSVEEHQNWQSPRFVANQFAHQPHWKPYGPSEARWFGLESRSLDLGLDSDIRLIPLFGHTFGHCGVALQGGDKWLLHAGDTYYRRIEVDSSDNPIDALAAHSADDNALRLQSLQKVRNLLTSHGDEVEVFSTHDITEFPAENQS